MIRYNQTVLPDEPRAKPVDDSVPIPPRFWWLKRILITSGALIVALVALRLWWGWYAERQLQAEIDRIIAAGEPIFPEDFDSKEDISNERNAAIHYEQAAVGLTSEFESIRSFTKNPRSMLSHREAVAKLVRKFTPNLDEAHIARGLPDVDWNVQYASPVMSTMLPTVSDQSLLTRILCIASTNSYLDGMQSDAIEKLQGAIDHSRKFEKYPFLVSHVVNSRDMGELLSVIQEIAPTLCVQSDKPSSRVCVDRETVRVLIKDLLDEEASRAALLRGIYEERMVQLDAVRGILSGRTSTATLLGFFGMTNNTWHVIGPLMEDPLLASDAIEIFQKGDLFVEAAKQQSYPAVVKVLSTQVISPSPRKFHHPLRQIVWQWDSRQAFVNHFTAIAMRRMAATRLAMRMFEIDDGEFPESLDQLVPKYLQTVPEDPYSAEQRKILYLPNSSQPLLYSVGVNGIDEGGNHKRTGGGIDDEYLDIPFFLNGFPTELNSEE